MRYVLGIDVGTSSTKTVLLSENGDVVAVGQQAYDFDTPQPGWAEQDPEMWWDAAKSAIAQVLRSSSVAPQTIQAIGFSGQMHGPVFLDAAGRSIRPAIIWADQRSTAECRKIYDTLGKDGLYKTVCNPVDSGFMAATLLWMKAHEAEHYAQIDTLLLPKDYVKFRLSGERVSDPSDAGGTSLYDVRARTWSTTLCDQLGISSELFPAVRASQEIIGRVSHAAAAESGLAPGTPLVNGGNDQTMGALASGAIEEGPVMLAIGTGGTLFTTIDSVVVDPELRMHTYPHCLPDKWHLLGAILAGGLNFKWFRNILKGADVLSYDDMTSEAATVAPGSEGVVFLPYLAGERTPHMDSFARGVLFGMTVRHTRAHLIRAIMEGVVFAMRDCLELFKGLNVRPERIIAAGGGAQSPLWRQIQADVLGLPLATVKTPEKSATGAAMLAGIGTGLFTSFEEACRQTVTYGEVVDPIPEHILRYEEYYHFYTSLYPSVKTRFSDLAKLEC
ncbi:xylulokinase [candidate division KSB3 bacterium]|uniref:Xylulose kinase n=1 Tax=candidate division KSB3 bacterium TaxID=2044937 RepID=A0A2G6E8J4_9BACT|nr:MAG: xylulokinase [candidate division KSB3 bacterium]PIE30572.1 MAG: xylulokinase [candidate division KSB3 bacterium]